MSFGFSVGDIILLGQLSYQIYQSVTTGRKKASRDLAELGDVLFGLRCALDHLKDVANDISSAAATTTAAKGSKPAERRAQLDQMIRGCATTLEDLHNVTKTYREGASPEEPSDDPQSAVLTLSRTARIKQRIATNVMKVRWDMDKESLKGYREKLQTHADAINLVLNAFLWSTTNEIQTDGKAHAQQLSNLHNTVVSSNSSLAQMMKEIHAAVIRPTSLNPAELAGPFAHGHPSSAVAFMAIESGGIDGVGGFGGTGGIGGIGGIGGGNIQAHYANAAPEPPLSMPIRPRPPPPEPNLPPAIALMNIRRQQNAMNLLPQKRPVVKKPPPPRPNVFTIPHATVEELKHGLDYIFSANAMKKPGLSTDIETWVRLLDGVLDLRPPLPELVKKQDAALVDLIIHLNELVDRASAQTMRLFFEALSVTQLDDVLAKLVKTTRSVRAEKEVDDFTDLCDEWKEGP